MRQRFAFFSDAVDPRSSVLSLSAIAHTFSDHFGTSRCHQSCSVSTASSVDERGWLCDAGPLRAHRSAPADDSLKEVDPPISIGRSAYVEWSVADEKGVYQD